MADSNRKDKLAAAKKKVYIPIMFKIWSDLTTYFDDYVTYFHGAIYFISFSMYLSN